MGFFKKILWIFVFVFAISGCGNKEEEKSNKVEQKTEPVQYFEVLIGNKEVRTGDFCNWTFEITNNTKINFTNLALDIIARDTSGNIIEKTVVRWNNVIPSANIAATRLLNGCQLITSFEFVGFSETSKINDEYIKKGEVSSNQIKSASKVASITTKSAGGEVMGVVANAIAPVTEMKKNQDENLTLVDTGSTGLAFFKPDSNACKKVTGMTTDLAEGWARNSNASVGSIRYLRMKISGDDCSLMIDTSTGPMECLVGSVVKTTNGDYLASAYRVNSDGTKMSVTGMCSKPW